MRRGVLLLLVLVMGMNCWLVPYVRWLVPAPTPTPRVRDFALRELLIDFSALSSNCRPDRPPKELPYEEKPGDVEEDLYFTFSCNGSSIGGMYAIYRFRDSRVAAKRYRNLPGWFSRACLVTPYTVPDWMQYQSPVADQFRFACADFQGYTGLRWRRCVAIGQYEEYISAFDLDVSPPESMADYTMLVEDILRAIDERMEFYLKGGEE